VPWQLSTLLIRIYTMCITRTLHDKKAMLIDKMSMAVLDAWCEQHTSTLTLLTTQVTKARVQQLMANHIAKPKNGQIPLRYLVADRFEAGRRHAARARISACCRSATSLEPVCDQIRAGLSYLEMSPRSHKSSNIFTSSTLLRGAIKTQNLQL